MNERVEARLDALYAIGGREGANRPGLSAEEEEAHRLAAGWMREAGLDVRRDAAGNTFGRLPGTAPDGEEVWVGSHLDSVPSGGRFDGALGVVAAIEALERLQEAPRSRDLVAVAFRDEEGWRFGRGFFGSRAVCGEIGAADLEARDREGVTVGEALAALGIEGPSPSRPTAALPGVFLEAHVEQGPVLADAGAPLGVVGAIAGNVGLRIAFSGSAGHAGTVPLARRRDALVAAARYVTALRDAAAAMPDAVATVGECTIPSAAANVVPGCVELAVDARAPGEGTLARLLLDAERLAHEAARAEGCEAGVELLFRHPPVAMDPGVRELLAQSARRVGCEPPELVSGAGHDAGTLAAAGVAAGMLLVRSGAGGISHSPAETTDPEAVELSVEALAAALAELASEPLSHRGHPATVGRHHNRHDAARST